MSSRTKQNSATAKILNLIVKHYQMFRKKFAGFPGMLFFECWLLFMDKKQSVAPGQHFHLKPQ